MSLIPERLRPYLAGLLGTLATGFGHLYLRRWLRGFGWIALAFGVTAAFVPDSALQSMAAGEAVSTQSALYPTMAVQLAGAFDAFLLAYRNRTDDATGAEGPVVADATADAEGSTPGTVACPNCGKEVDADLGFCHWCTTEFVTPDPDSN
ncbi:zinc ribbon domain-containing protein [Halolamina litorea]|uniref:Zinc ribbon domain-containing protein n=1 Tax=Halolamina litorea TaxID=1515593 RepID=A0ABD6BT09_9EURY|nr:zinc ribbon domain-containing protein [Halolamina litorea]